MTAGIPKSYDVIVVGAGSMGMSAGYHLATRGWKTLLIDAYDPPHAHGSHHGDTRMIRHAYAGGETYVRMALRADRLWRELEEISGQKLLERSGVLNAADPEVYAYGDKLQDAAELGVAVEMLDADEIRYRWRGWRLPDGFKAMYEPQAGYLYSERCIEAYKRAAIAAGAVYLPHTRVTDVAVTGGAFAFVTTPREVYHADNVILCAGAWFPALASTAPVPVRSVRKVVGWFETSGGLYRQGEFPGFTLGTRQGSYYGFPDIGGAGLKIGRHDGGRDWQPGETLAPFGEYAEDEDDLRLPLRTFLPGAAGKLQKGMVCKYEMSPDEGFIIDTHPAYPNVLLAAGFSGHGFKFASAVGEILADLTIQRRTELDLKPFSYWRFEESSRRIHFSI